MMMMRHFRIYDTMMFLKKMVVVLFFFLGAATPFIAATAAAAASGGLNPVVEFSSREELVRIAGYGEDKLSIVTIIGQVLCHVCVDDEKAQLSPYPISGASVAVFCGNSGKKRKSWARSSTDSYGEFLIDLPSHLHSIPNIEKMCHVHVLHLPKSSPCRPAFTGKRKGIKLSSMEDGIRTYTTQRIHLTPRPSQPCKNKETTYAY